MRSLIQRSANILLYQGAQVFLHGTLSIVHSAPHYKIFLKLLWGKFFYVELDRISKFDKVIPWKTPIRH